MARDADTPLGSLVALRRGVTYQSSMLGKPGPFLLGLGSIARNGGFRAENLKTYGGESDPRTILGPGDIYVSLKDVTQSADLLGAVARVPDFVLQGRLTQDTVKLEFIKPGTVTEYIYWILRTPQYREYCRAHATGTTNLGLPREDFLSYPIPPLTSSRQMILELLELVESKIEINRRTNETLEATAQALFKDWFVDFGPTRAKSIGGEPYLSSEMWSKFPNRLDRKSLPETWKESTVGAEFRLTMGQSPPGESYNKTGSGLPFFQGKTDFGARYPSKRIYCNAPSRIAKADDTLLSVRAPVGSVNMSWEDCCLGRGVAAIRHVSGHRGFTYYALLNLRPALAKFEHSGTVFGAINKPQLEALYFVAPEQGAVDAFELCVTGMDDRIRSNEAEMALLVEIRDLLLPELIKGEVRATDAQSIVKGAI